MTVTLSIILAISIIINLGLGFYAIAAARRIYVISSNLSSIQEELVSFQDHLESIYELETFYGDETLKSLLDHSREVAEELTKYENIYELTFDLEDTESPDVEEVFFDEKEETE
tara:strand:- start:1927 stop:2268 length:342 start_codon:yes stop_codon:yes gene_type:complete